MSTTTPTAEQTALAREGKVCGTCYETGHVWHEAPTFEGKTAAEWEAKAADALRREQESWERSDTDGFLSQHALQQMARRYRDCARVAELGGFDVVGGFQDIETGELLPGNWRPTQYGSGWAVDGRPWLFPSYARKGATAERNDARKGFRRVWVVAPQRLEHSTHLVINDTERAAEWRLATAAESADLGAPYDFAH